MIKISLLATATNKAQAKRTAREIVRVQACTSQPTVLPAVSLTILLAPIMDKMLDAESNFKITDTASLHATDARKEKALNHEQQT